MRILPRCVAPTLLGLMIAGAALAEGTRVPTVASPVIAHGSFRADLRACQTAVGGRLERRRRLDASQPRVAACLLRRGWNADGTPSLDRLLATG